MTNTTNKWILLETLSIFEIAILFVMYILLNHTGSYQLRVLNLLSCISTPVYNQIITTGIDVPVNIDM